MLINDFSQQDFLNEKQSQKTKVLELIAAGVIFIAPILFLIILAS